MVVVYFAPAYLIELGGFNNNLLLTCMRRKNVKYYMVHFIMHICIYIVYNHHTPITSGNVIHLTSRLDKNRHNRELE